MTMTTKVGKQRMKSLTIVMSVVNQVNAEKHGPAKEFVTYGNAFFENAFEDHTKELQE